MTRKKLACPVCDQTQSQVQPVGDLFQVSCQSCKAAGPISSSPEFAIQLWEQLCQEVNLSQLIIDESPDVIFVKNQQGRYLLGNPTLAKLYGTTPEALIGNDDSPFNPNKEQVDFYLRNTQDVIASGKTQYVEESSTDSSTGEIRHYLSLKKPFLGPDNDKRLLVIAKDVTDLKSANHDLQSSEKRYADAMNIAGEGLWDWDIRNDTVTHNMRWCEILGLESDSLVHPVADFVALLFNEDIDGVSESLNAMLSDPTGALKYESEHRMCHASGKIIWVHDRGQVVERDEDGTPLRVVGAVRDITERKEFELQLNAAQQELAELNTQLEATVEQRTNELLRNEERFALAMRSANDGLWEWDIQNNQMYYAPRWKSMLGYAEDEINNDIEVWSSLVHPDDKDEALQRALDYISGVIDTFEVEIRMQHKDGHYIFVRSRAFKLVDDSTGQVTRLVGTHVDISDKKKSEILDKRTTRILEMIAKGSPAAEIYDEIALLYESRHPGLRCSLLELDGTTLLHGGAPSMPREYCEAVNGLQIGPEVGSCGTSTFTGRRVIVEDIATDPKWADLKGVALPHGMRCCWSEPIINSAGTVLGAFGMYYDHPAVPNEDESVDLTAAARLAGIIMEREHNQKQIRELAYTDALTGLSSRDYFYQKLEETLKQSERSGIRFGLLYIDLDNFKAVNDSLGHDVGDKLLQETANRLRQACRDVDLTTRLGGDEFCIIIDDVTDHYSAGKVAERCLELISNPLELQNRKITPSCSIGIAHYPDDGSNSRELIKAADTALYEAKGLGKNRFAFYKKELTHQAEHRFRVEQYLKEAIENQEFRLVYQPQVDLSNGALVGLEALSRWHHPQLGNVNPEEFIRIIEQIGMMKTFTKWVVETACNDLVRWKNAGLNFEKVAVNVSPNCFLDKKLQQLVEFLLKENRIPASQFELEVTENVVQTAPQNLLAFSNLKELGITIAIDDFGTGYSSFSSLKHMSIDLLKIDKHFINDMLSDEKTRLVVGSMIEMGHNLGYRVIAEGIEEKEQLEMLKDLGCDFGQGYLFSKPLEIEQLENYLSHAG